MRTFVCERRKGNPSYRASRRFAIRSNHGAGQGERNSALDGSRAASPSLREAEGKSKAKDMRSQGLDLWVRGWLLSGLTAAFRPVTAILTAGTLACGGLALAIRRWLTDDEPMTWGGVAELMGGIAIGKDRDAPLSDYGPAIKREDAPELFAEIGRVAQAVGVRPPEQVRLAALPCCAATAWRRSRALIVGLPLFAVLERAELQSILAHELAHFAWGDVTRTARAMRFLEGLGEALDEAPGGWRRFAPARLWAKGARAAGDWLAAPIARGQEDRADRAAAKVAGGPAAASALIKTAMVQPLFREASDYYQHDCGVTLFAFFREFYGRLPHELLAQMRMSLVIHAQSADDFHPPLADRVAVLQSLPNRPASSAIANGQGQRPSHSQTNGDLRPNASAEPAAIALGDLEALERLVHESLFGPMIDDEGPSVFHRAYT